MVCIKTLWQAKCQMVQLQNIGIGCILWMFNHVFNMTAVACTGMWGIRTELGRKCIPLLMRSAVWLPLWGLLAFEGIRTILLEQFPHHWHAPPLWSYHMRTHFAQRSSVFICSGFISKNKIFVKLVDFLISFNDWNSLQANNLVSGEQRGNIAAEKW